MLKHAPKVILPQKKSNHVEYACSNLKLMNNLKALIVQILICRKLNMFMMKVRVKKLSRDLFKTKLRMSSTQNASNHGFTKSWNAHFAEFHTYLFLKALQRIKRMRAMTSYLWT